LTHKYQPPFFPLIKLSESYPTLSKKYRSSGWKVIASNEK
jgi:hypothetical protein